jgi:MoxR-like ATPase
MLSELVEQCSQGLVDRRTLVESIVLAAVAGEHVLIIGPPGTAKSEAARRVARALGGNYFEYLLGKFSEPSEIFGPADLRKLKEGVLETATAGMLPEAEIAFLDEVFAGSTAILNSLLTLLNERIFRRGNTQLRCPLRVCIGASNALPEEESLAAFADRFLVRMFVTPISDSLLEQLLEIPRQSPTLQGFSLELLDQTAQAAQAVDLRPVLPLLAEAYRRLRKAGILLSDRRMVRARNLVAAAAALSQRSQASAADLWPIVLTLASPAQQASGRECLQSLLGESDNLCLYGLAEEVSSAYQVKARRLLEEGQRLLQGEPAQLKIEGVLRELDAHFSPENCPQELKEMRQKLFDLLS